MSAQKMQKSAVHGTRGSSKPESNKFEQDGLLQHSLDRLAGSMNGVAEVLHGRSHPILQNDLADADIAFERSEEEETHLFKCA